MPEFKVRSTLRCVCTKAQTREEERGVSRTRTVLFWHVLAHCIFKEV